MQLVFPNDELFAIAVEGISSTETASPGVWAEDVADLVLYYGVGDNFKTCERLETIQFKYKHSGEPVTASYLKKTIEKFSSTISGYEREFSADEVTAKAWFAFVTNAEFKDSLSEAIESLIVGTTPSGHEAAAQVLYLKECCVAGGLSDARRLFSRIAFRAGEKGLSGQDNALRRTLTDWSAGADAEAKMRLYGLQDLVLKKAGPSGQGKNLIRREDVLDALDCAPEDLFPADTRFIDVGAVVERSELSMVHELIKASKRPLFVDAEGGIGKTVFVQSLAARMENEFEVVVFDCFGGGSYRSDNHSRHLPKIGLVQIVNELASRTLCDPMLPGGDDSRKVIRTARKRLAQAATAIRTQSEKLGLLIVVDAADNAQLEAEHRHEDAFPKLLLAAMDEDPIDGVKLLLTARTHRRDLVIGRSEVIRVELGPFTDPEAREFLRARKPDASSAEVATALARSGRNARVLDYLVQTWNENVRGRTSAAVIDVPEIIAQRCMKIVSDLHVAGWTDSEVTEFFVALSLLPPPIPLHELANALGWSAAQVGTAASDLAPMLEVTAHGAIFRDEPTETYIRETYSEGPEAQRAIADRLLASQGKSAYVAEALPHFLVVIKDSDRAFALADSTSFPATVQSDFGRRRLTLARLRAAFRLAVAVGDLDRVLGLSMRMAQAATADLRGDEFIRSSPALAIVLGDADSYRRLFADRSGWRGARSARLTVAHRFANDVEESEIQCASTVRWINWDAAKLRDEMQRRRAGPETKDFAALLFQHSAAGKFDVVDRNLDSWNVRFSLSVSGELLHLLEQFDQANGATIIADLVSFATSNECKSQALKLRLLSLPRSLNRRQVSALAKGIGEPLSIDHDVDDGVLADSKQGSAVCVVQAALTALLYSSRAAAAAIVRQAPLTRPSAYDYSERYGPSRAWTPILCACVRAWSSGRPVAYHDLLPREVGITKQAKAVSTEPELLAFLKKLDQPALGGSGKKRGEKPQRARFSERECENISKGVEMIRRLTRPIEEAVLSRRGLSDASVTAFLDAWRRHFREGVHWRAEVATDFLVRTAGLGCIHILLDHAPEVSEEHAKTIISLASSEKFSVGQKISVLAQLSKRSALHELAGQFAQHVAEQIGRDDDIEQRGRAYADLAASLVSMSIDEARDYYQQGLGQLDQLGGESYDQIYSLLRFASAQQGGFLKPQLSHRLMNLCQGIVRNEPGKFGWTLFAQAAASSIGFQAIAKIVRWHDQDVADLSYGLPQLACFLAKNGHLDARRAAFFVTVCEDQGSWDWRPGDAVADLLRLSEPTDQRRISLAIIEKLHARYPFGGFSSLWEGFLAAGNQVPNALTSEEREAIGRLSGRAQREDDGFDSHDESGSGFADSTPKPSKEEIDSLIAALVSKCDSSSAHSIDQALINIKADNRLTYDARQRFITGLRVSCPYPKRLAFLFAVCDATELSLTQSLDIVTECIDDWSRSSKHLVSNAKSLVERLFESKVVELFEGQFSDIVRGIHRLSELCGDKHFVLRLVLRKVVAEEVELDGNEWLQLATALCDVTSDRAGLDALELFLSGSASRIADEIGEGAFRPEQAVGSDEVAFFVDVIWHLLGDDDSYLRWSVAKGLSTLVELGLDEELGLLLGRFNQREIPALASADRGLPFQNSQQWLLMGLARVALRHGRTIAGLRRPLLALAEQSDLHIIDQVHIVRCLRNIGYDGIRDIELEALFDHVDQPPCGIEVSDVYSGGTKATSSFRFDYEFAKSEISSAARLFNVGKATVVDAMATEITRRWPEATSLDDFPGRQRYEWKRGDRYETYREHVQRHALLSAVTTLSKTRPVVVRSYESGGDSPWLEWRNRYDITFDDGSWLSDRKDPVPTPAKQYLLGKRTGEQENLRDQPTVLRKLGLVSTAADELVLLYGHWSSPDGVRVRITSALTERNGAIGRCMAFAKQPGHELWLPEFWDQGIYDSRLRQKSIFSPLVWAPETHSLGIDLDDEMAAEGAAGRPRLGIELTKSLRLSNVLGSGDWCTAEGSLALRSHVWGSWKPDPDDHRGARDHDDGEVLWASPDWLAAMLSKENKLLVSTITLWKYRSSRENSASRGVRSVLVGLRLDDGTLRTWHAKKASKPDYWGA